MTPPLPTTYSPLIQALLTPPRLNPLDAGQPNRAARDTLADDDAVLFQPHAVRDRVVAQACRAGLWLYHDFLDEAHTISQDIETAEGSYWHALVHRREPDHANAAYWFRQVGVHAVFEPLRLAAAELAASAPPPGQFLARQDRWDPFAFNDLCAASHEATAPCHDLCRRVQQAEWDLLFAFCYCQAVGHGG